MNIKECLNTLNKEKVRDVIALNEISGNENVICRFSFAGGISGYSFGRSQFDIKHNKKAIQFLKNKCNFTEEEIQRLEKLEKNIDDLNLKLSKYRKEIDELDNEHVNSMITHVSSLNGLPDFESQKVFVHLVDYHNQFNLSKDGKMHQWLKSIKVLKAEDILNFKLGLKWGKTNPQDVKRRWNNIEKNF